jgi:hypothetical protein
MRNMSENAASPDSELTAQQIPTPYVDRKKLLRTLQHRYGERNFKVQVKSTSNFQATDPNILAAEVEQMDNLCSCAGTDERG